MRVCTVIGITLGLTLCGAAMGAAAPASVDTGAAPTRVSVLSADQVIEILDQTVNWYRTLGSQQQNANQPSDLLILYANRQTATQVVGLAFDVARANAELLSSEASSSESVAGSASTAQTLNRNLSQLDAQSAQVQTELEAARKHDAAKANELGGELAMLNARRNLLQTMTQFVSGSDAKNSKANALKAYIDAMQASIPSPSANPAAATSTSSAAPLTVADATTRRLGIWELASNVFRLSSKLGTIDSVDKSTEALEQLFAKFRAAPIEQIKALAARSEALAAAADSAGGSNPAAVRNQLDTVAWLFKQTAAIVIPLSKEQVLLEQYRHNLANWHQTVKRQYWQALVALAVRIGVLLVILALLFAGGELWRRAVLRYEHELRRRQQLLLLRRITLWTLVVVVVGFTFITQLSSIATFAGLITAGIAVAMQSVLVSIVGYFFLIGKYGVRVGDRVQIGDVTGEVVELGLVRMHLMELSSEKHSGPTGRIVAFANSIVFQNSGGMFRQFPGVNFAWHEVTLSLPAGSDYTALKDELLAAVSNVVKKYQAEMVQQTRELEETLANRDVGDATPQVQLKFSAGGVEANVRYPVHLSHAAEIDEQVSEALLKVISAHTAH